MTVIATNTNALRATTASNSANSMLSTSIERLSTGKRINSAKDDAAGLAIATSMESQITGMNQGVRNANDGISMAQSAEGALDDVTNNLQRMRELEVQKENGTYSTTDKANIQTEQDALATQINNVVQHTQFNGINLFKGDAGTSGVVSIQAGANASDAIAVNLGSDLMASGSAGLTGVVSTTSGGVTTAAASGSGALAAYDTAIALISNRRASLGAAQNQLTSAANNLTSDSTNLSSAQSSIQDTDFSAESTALAKAQILSQASTAMLAQANQSQQGVLKLLQ